MTKLMTTILALALTVTLTACGQNNSTTPESLPETSGTPNSSDKADGVTAESAYLYGKITGIVGNEIEIAVAKLPDMEASGGGASDSEPSGDMQAVPMTPATTLEPVEGDAGDIIELTGEVHSLTIPSGVKIHSAGQEIALTALKKGGIVMVRLDNLTDKTVLSVDVLQ